MSAKLNLMAKSIVLVGDPNTSEAVLSQAQSIRVNPVSTSSVTMMVQVMVDGKSVRLSLYNATHRLAPNYVYIYSIVQGAMVLYDVADRTTFENASKWVQDIKENVPNLNKKLIMIVGSCHNATPTGPPRVVSTWEGKGLALKLMVEYMEVDVTSSDDATSVVQAFTVLAENMIKKQNRKIDLSDTGPDSATFEKNRYVGSPQRQQRQTKPTQGFVIDTDISKTQKPKKKDHNRFLIKGVPEDMGDFAIARNCKPSRKKNDLKLFKKAVARKGSVTYLMVQCMPFGPPRVGKTCLYNLLINKPMGVPTTKKKLGSGSLSTDALTGRTIINVNVGYRNKSKAIVATASGCTWSEVPSLDEEIALYINTTKQQLGNEKPTAANELKRYDSISSLSEMVDLPIPAGTQLIKKLPNSNGDEDSGSLALQPENAKKSDQIFSRTMFMEEAILEIITEPLTDEKLDKDGAQALLKDSLTIFYTDTGGQPEFQEVLPALVAGPTIFLLTFSLFSPKKVKSLLFSEKLIPTDPLNALYQVRYDSSEERFVDYESSFTVKDVLLQCLSSIACFRDGLINQMGSTEPDSTSTGATPVSAPPISVLILGTHRDLVQQEDVDEVDRSLREALTNVDLMDKGLIEEYEFQKQLVIPINNFNPSDGQKVRQILEQVVRRVNENGQSPYKIELPLHWLGLELYLRRSDKSTMKYSKCKAAARWFDISEDELGNCLKYLHYKTGTIRYYDGVEELKDIVIIKPSVIFAAITKLITSTFIPKNVKSNVQHKFTQYGLFKQSQIEHIFRGNSESLQLTLDQFLALLRHLNILSRAYKMSSTGLQDEEQFDYFLPCALTHAPVKDIKSTDSPAVLSNPLLVSFKNGFVPKGIFSGLLACFSGIRWEIKCSKGQPLLYRNQATFSIDQEMCSVTMQANSKFLEFSLEFYEDSPQTDNMLAFYNVQEIITDAITTECCTLNYAQNWKLGVYCSNIQECQTASLPPHVAILNSDKKTAHCPMANRSFPLTDDQSCWFTPAVHQGILNVSDEDLKIAKEKIFRVLTHQADFTGSAKGIAFVVGITEADGVYIDIQNIRETFHGLKFLVYPDQNLTCSELACLVKAAADFEYPITIKFIAFYFAGHGGIDSKGRPFVMPMNCDESKYILLIDHNILEPFRRREDNAPLKKGRRRRQCLFLFDCCLSEAKTLKDQQTESEFKLQNPPPDSVVAYSTSVGSKSQGDSKRGGLWTRHLCQNLSNASNICLSKILISTRSAVAEDSTRSDNGQLPHYEWNTGPVYLNGKPLLNDKGNDLENTSLNSTKLSKAIEDVKGAIKSPTPSHKMESADLAASHGHLNNYSGTRSSSIRQDGYSNASLCQNNSSFINKEDDNHGLQPAANLGDSIEAVKPVSWKPIYTCLRNTASCWSDLALDLEISDEFRDELRQGMGGTDRAKLEKVLREWIDNRTCEVTWEKIISVLKNLGFNEQAEKLSSLIV